MAAAVKLVNLATAVVSGAMSSCGSLPGVVSLTRPFLCPLVCLLYINFLAGFFLAAGAGEFGCTPISVH